MSQAVALLAFIFSMAWWLFFAQRKGTRLFNSKRSNVLTEAESLNDEAVRLCHEGAFSKAILLAEQARSLREEALNPEHPDVAHSLHTLASLYWEQGAYAKAEPLFERALRINEKALGQDHPDVAQSLNGLAMLYHSQGAYAKAEPLFERALRIHEKAFDQEHPYVAQSLNNLASIYRAQGAYMKAEPLFERTLRLREKELGQEHPHVAISLNNLAALYRAQEAYAKAEPLFERALRIHEKALGQDHPHVAVSLNSLASIYHSQGAYAKAEPLFERALRAHEKAFDREHPDLATLLNNLAVVSWANGNVRRAHGYLVRSIASRERHLVHALAGLPEPRKRLLLQTASAEAEQVVSFHAHSAPNDVDALLLALTTILQRKGRVLDEVAHAQAALRRNLSPSLQAELDAVQARRAELASLRLAPLDLRHAEVLRAMADDVECRESELSRQSVAFRAQLEPVTIETAQATLPRDAALVEFVHYRRFDSKDRARWKEARYLAYVLRPEGPPQWVPLGEAVPIEVAVALALDALASGEGDAREPLRALDELVFAPLRRLLGPVNHWLLSPDGILNRVPFAALVDEEGRHLLERALITYLTSGRDRVRAMARGASHAKPIVVAAPDYQGRFTPLPGTLGEANIIGEHFPEAGVFVGLAATKHVITRVKGPLFVHLATHGFFGVPSAVAVRDAKRRDARSWRDDRDLVASESSFHLLSESDAPTVLGALSSAPEENTDLEDALDMAGLVLAQTEGSDAVITARDIANLNLDGTQLVVLSACETGVGRIDAGEGVYGLRRALAIAGAETQVVSLWKVDDDATAALMGRYYGGLRAGGGRAEALRQTQLALLRGEGAAEGHDYTHPFYWAAFVPIGDEGPLRLAPADA